MKTSDLIAKINEFNSLKDFMKEHKITKSDMEANQEFLEIFLENYQECSQGYIEECQQVPKGYQPFLEWNHKMFYSGSRHCLHWMKTNKNYEIKKNFVYCDYNVDDNFETISSYDKKLKAGEVVDESRVRYVKLINTIIKNNYKKGVFLSGLPGVGKTFLLQITANQFAQKNKVAFITVSNLIKTVKDGFSNNELQKENLLRSLMRVDYLFLDDIGGEVVTAYSRDEILFTLLNYRMENKKPTFFSANFRLNKLDAIYGVADINNNDREIIKMKTKRFTERIKGLVIEDLMINGENKRHS
ncbi:ATP-binding protein [Spiroplasma alleghenense]|uniref:Primosomal protein DnaI n=1 Tax=Spiroplasma alleghenense TaxID=216931 RepID=A0A345Z447_9MOLU|nr:ATP-binding protein [Spiroplasma alleghenense]AXK51376.1 primosomal protein DnaI [Spiroplasma alleghenense]